MKILFLFVLLATARAAAEDAPLVDPTPVTITADDVYELQADNRQEKLERSIRRDMESVSNWSDDNDD